MLHTTTVMVLRTNWTTTLTFQEGLIDSIYAFATFGVPHFIFISGFVLYNKYSKDFSLSTFYKKRFLAILAPYITFTAFYVFYPYIGAALYRSLFHVGTVGHNAIPSVVSLVTEYATALLTGVDQLWFIVLLLELYLLYPLLVRFYNRFGHNSLYLSLLFIVTNRLRQSRHLLARICLSDCVPLERVLFRIGLLRSRALRVNKAKDCPNKLKKHHARSRALHGVLCGCLLLF